MDAILGTDNLTPEHRDLMTEDHDLRVLGRLAAAQQHQPAEDLDHEQVEQAEGHKPRSCRNRFIRPSRRSQYLWRVLNRYRADSLRSQAQGILALDLFTVNLLNGAKVHVLAVIEHGSRRVRILGATEHPVQAWVVQQARNLLMDLAGAGTRVKFVIHDRDASFTTAFNEVFRATGARILRSAIQAPRMNSIMERWIGSCLRELLDWTLIWNQRHLMMVLREYEDFYNSHCPHRALTLDQAAPLKPLPDRVTDLDHFRIQRHDRAGGVIHEHHPVA